MRGKGKVGREMENVIHHQHEATREKNKLLYKREYEKMKKEDETMGQDMDFLEKIDSKFDPLDSYFHTADKQAKRARYE